MKLNKIMYGTLLSTALLSSQYVMTTPTYAAENTGVVWEDKNQNGKMDAGESGINNIKMDLFTVNGSLIKSSTTDSQGKYSFGDVADGKYYAKVNVPQNYRFFGTAPYFGSDGLTKYITVTQNNLKNLNAGLVKSETPPQVEHGLLGEYYTGVFFNNKVMERVDKNITISDLPDALGKVPENFSIRWTGKIKAPQTGEYKIITNSDDGVRVYINDEAVIDDYNVMSKTKHTSRSISLNKDELYNIKIEYFNGPGLSIMELLWSINNGPEQQISSDSLYSK
ncbi:PA14 domain-containing protein [Bacillus sp. FSL K6-0268]|uniref:PA14 domain-containing protein n=1 Tax=Bacillus sp. FSL K6-0268 TaxID=2921449 RepID=UPI0030F59C57